MQNDNPEIRCRTHYCTICYPSRSLNSHANIATFPYKVLTSIKSKQRNPSESSQTQKKRSKLNLHSDAHFTPEPNTHNKPGPNLHNLALLCTAHRRVILNQDIYLLSKKNPHNDTPDPVTMQSMIGSKNPIFATIKTPSPSSFSASNPTEKGAVPTHN